MKDANNNDSCCALIMYKLLQAGVVTGASVMMYATSSDLRQQCPPNPAFHELALGIAQALFVILFKLAALVFVCAGATFTLEVLGPLPDAEDTSLAESIFTHVPSLIWF